MSRSTVTFSIAAILILLATGCSRSSSSPAETQAGDTACADHEIAKRVRHLAQLDPEKGEFADDIVFTSAGGASPFAHRLCASTWHNGKKLGDEAKAVGC